MSPSGIHLSTKSFNDEATIPVRLTPKRSHLPWLASAQTLKLACRSGIHVSEMEHFSRIDGSFMAAMEVYAAWLCWRFDVTLYGKACRHVIHDNSITWQFPAFYSFLMLCMILTFCVLLNDSSRTERTIQPLEKYGDTWSVPNLNYQERKVPLSLWCQILMLNDV